MGRIEEIWNGDRLIQDFGMKLLEAREGYARVTVRVEERFLNAHNIGHGVLLFAAADAAFALSVNAAIDAVGVQWSINIIRAAKLGEEIVGESRVFHRGRQSMVCELTVTGEDGRLLLRGQSTAMPVTRTAYAEKAAGKRTLREGPAESPQEGGAVRPAFRVPFPQRPCTERVDAPSPARRPTEAYPLRYDEGGERCRGGCSGPRMPGSEGMEP